MRRARRCVPADIANHPGYDEIMHAETVKRLAQECGFELAGIAAAEPIPADFARYESWVHDGMAGKMGYLTDRRAEMRRDPRNLLPGARSVICVGKFYNTMSLPLGGDAPPADEVSGIISRYARGRDYHDFMRASLEELAEKLLAIEAFEWKVCVDTAPILERSYARQAGLGWIGRNQCLINEPLGSWFLLGELLTSLVMEPDSPPADRCGTCTQCIEACPTQALVPVLSKDSISGKAPNPNDDKDVAGEFRLDARRCISYLNIELRGPIPEEHRQSMGTNIFGCDICQDVCPWNRRAPETADPVFHDAFDSAPPLESLAYLTQEEFRARYRNTPVTRSKYDGFVRNVAVAMGASGQERFREPLEHLARSASPLVAEHARWALQRINMNRVNEEHAKVEALDPCVETLLR
jgi:epoxyqueuosine reductase